MGKHSGGRVMKRVLFRGDRSCPFELFLWDNESPSEGITITLTPKQVVRLIANMSDGYASWIEDKAISERAVDPPYSIDR